MTPSTVQTYIPTTPLFGSSDLEFFREIPQKVVYQCRVWITQINLRFEMMTFIFFRTIGFFFPYLSYQCEAMFGHLQALYLRFRAAQERALLEEDIRVIRKDNARLDARVQNLVETMEASILAAEQAAYENNEARREIQILTEQRKQLFFDRIPILAEKDRLLRENRELREERNQLIAEKELSHKEKQDAEARCRQALLQLQEIHLRLDRMEDYRLLNEQLGQFHQLYMELPKNRDEKGMTQRALDELIPCYKEHREKLHNTLRQAIDRLPQDGLETACLEGILRLSEEETLHLEQISQTLHLIEGLRVKFGEYFERAARQ